MGLWPVSGFGFTAVFQDPDPGGQKKRYEILIKLQIIFNFWLSKP
jgi:hypothetical protein